MKKSMLFFLLILAAAQTPAQELGVQIYSFRNQLKTDLPGTLQKIKDMGLTNLEGEFSYYGLSIAEFKQLLDRKKMKMVTIAATYEKLQTDLYTIMGDAKILGAKYVVCHWIPHENNEFTIDHARKAVEVFNEAGKKLREKGITLCYHPHGYEFRPYESGTLFDYIVTKSNPQYLAFEMDVFWVKHPGQDPVELLKKYAGRFELMHLKDRKPGTPGNQNGKADVETNVVLGQGDVGIAAVMKVARKYGVKYAFIEDESSRSLEQVPQSLSFLRSLKK
jgi:sugar phosphate isomerase/epimerase